MARWQLTLAAKEAFGRCAGKPARHQPIPARLCNYESVRCRLQAALARWRRHPI